MDKSVVIGKNKLKAFESNEKAQKKQIANKLLDEMDKLYEREDYSARRWVWELIQNAKDVIVNDSVKIEIEVSDSYMEFRHSGMPFSRDNIVFLINQTSSKERVSDPKKEAPKTTGKFGTGFLTTHMLSKKVILKGVFFESDDKTFQNFSLTLNREGKTPEEMIRNVEETFCVFDDLDDEKKCPFLKDYKGGINCDTKFRYELNEEGRKVAELGLKDLNNSIFMTMSFLPEIESVTVDNKSSKTKTIYRRKNTIYEPNNIEISVFEKSQDEKSNEIRVILIRTKELSIAANLEEIDQRYGLKEERSNLPKLFVDFPLIGSENFIFPVFVNSHLFNPNEPRSSIYLKKESKSEQNKELFQKVLPLYGDLLRYASINLLNFHYLALTPLIKKEVDSVWFKKSIQLPMRKQIMSIDIFETSMGFIRIKNGLIPFVLNEKKQLDFKKSIDLSELATHFHPTEFMIAKPEILEFWIEAIDEDWRNDFKLEIFYGVEKLLSEISVSQNFDVLQSTFCFKDDDELFKFLNEILVFLQFAFLMR